MDGKSFCFWCDKHGDVMVTLQCPHCKVNHALRSVYSKDDLSVFRDFTPVQWKKVRDEHPPKHTWLWGWCCLYDKLHLCVWGGQMCDDGTPRLDSITEGADQDDYLIEDWQAAPIPTRPINVG